MSLLDLNGTLLSSPARVHNTAFDSAADANPGEMDTNRVAPRMMGDYVLHDWAGINTSNLVPIGKNVLVRMDQFKETMGGTSLKWHDNAVDRANLGAESGTIYAIGDQAWRHNTDGTLNTGMKPVCGDRVYTEKYAGREIMGDDGVKYRLMGDNCIAGLYRGENALIRAPEKGGVGVGTVGIE